jgi:hypothetical protein
VSFANFVVNSLTQRTPRLGGAISGSFITSETQRFFYSLFFAPQHLA